jgi:type VI secretion system protein ImpH
VRFFGLLGPQGPMPLHFTEYVRERLRFRGDATLARFLDVFHHRLLALFYRAWADAQPTVHHDRPGSDRFGAWLGASFGAEDAGPAPRALPEKARLFQAGLLGSRSRHAEGLVKLLRQYFHVPVRVEQHVPQWLVLETTIAAASASRAAARSDATRSHRSSACRRRAEASVATASTSFASRSAR